MAHAIDVSNFFRYIMNYRKELGVPTLKRINLLLYFANGEYIRKYDMPLFPESLTVRNGVVSSYFKFDKDDYTLSEVEKNLLFDILLYYGDKTTQDLIDIEKPIDTSYDTIKRYFKSRPALPPFRIPYKESDMITKRDDDGYLILPKDF